MGGNAWRGRGVRTQHVDEALGQGLVHLGGHAAAVEHLDIEDVMHGRAIGADMGGPDGEASVGEFACDVVKQPGAVAAGNLDHG